MSLEQLNSEQRKAAMATEGSVLILAGAGSGKTTVLVERIAYMIGEKGIDPYNILAITFTNKAAREMANRIGARIGAYADRVWISTFHSLCVRILRRTAERIGYTSDFIIFDSSDCVTAIKECLKELQLDEKLFHPKGVLATISSIKDDLMEPAVYAKTVGDDYRKKHIARIYERYQNKLKRSNAMDFDDIILNAVKALSENPDVLEYYQNRFRYVMVDEYQDTNNAQYVLISLLSGLENNLCVVGDDDQSIYKFRGANIRNILDFEEEHEDALVIKLEQNYRSTQNILNAANAVIANNKGRKPKALWTDNGGGNKVRLYITNNETEEAMTIASTIKKYVDNGGMYSDCAILYRTNAQSRVIEETFMKEKIPYKVLAGLRFFDRKEIKDITAYLRVVLNPDDDISLRRIINEPKRSIGLATVEKAQNIAIDNNTSIYEVISEADKYPELARAKSKLEMFVKMIDGIRDKAAEGLPIDRITDLVLSQSGYVDALVAENTIESKTRLENINEYRSVVQEFMEREEEEASLIDFLERVALVADIDSYNEEDDAVVMMTVHTAKGLEFEEVFLPGMDDGLFPGMRSLNTKEDMEEERRLCYVAFTRAKKDLHILTAEWRLLYGRSTVARPSRFIAEIPDEILDKSGRYGMRSEEVRRRHTDAIYKSIAEYNKQSEKKAQKALDIELDFKEGDIVEHKKFGRGTVISAQKLGNDMKLEINFEMRGKKLLMAAFAKLKKLS